MPEAAFDRDRLVSGAAALGIDLELPQVAALSTYADLLLRWNETFNLVSRRDVERLLPRHLLDSLSAAAELHGTRILDLGTGAGLPGVPLAIVRQELRFTLVDRNQRKIRFLDQVVRHLPLGNVTPVCADVADLPAADPFDTVVCRAVSAPAAVWSLAAPRLRPGGRLVVLHRSQRQQGGGEPAIPAGARLLGRRRVTIAGLERPHELIVLGAAA